MASRFLYLVRHGEATGDGVLSQDGEQQARLAGERLRHIPLAAVLDLAELPPAFARRATDLIVGGPGPALNRRIS
ncbi:MAG TPA: hypothetical protein VH520_12370 [Streptosporangiaceae bacterium]|jgi:probable phosphoglycerate mutase